MDYDFIGALATITAPYVIGNRRDDRYYQHALPTEAARRAAHDTPADEIPTTSALCGATAELTINWGAWESGNPLLGNGHRCMKCAWAVAIASDTLSLELDRLTPTAHDLVIYRHHLDNPLAVRHICEAIIAKATGPDAEVARADPTTEHQLATVSAHAPIILSPEACLDLECDHVEEHGDGELVRRCPPSAVSLACAACSNPHDDNERGEVYTPDRTVAAPCQVFTALAADHNVSGAVASAAATW